MKEQLYYQESGSGPIIVLMHGLLGSSAVWAPLTAILSKKYRVISLDLLGFGKSPKPRNVAYSPFVHLHAIECTLLPLLHTEKIILVGHSMGALLALEFTQKHPDRVKKLVLINPPLYKDRQEALDQINSSVFAKAKLAHGLFAGIVCEGIRWLNPLFQFATPFFVRQFPRQVVSDFYAHNWISYSRSLRNVIEGQDYQKLFKGLRCPTVIFYGDKDEMIVPRNITQLKSSKILVWQLHGDHMLPLTNASEISKKI